MAAKHSRCSVGRTICWRGYRDVRRFCSACSTVWLTGQRSALQRDLTHLRPLTRRLVGEQLGIHETVVDRAVKHARIQTPFGVLPLAAFFSTSKITWDNGEIGTSIGVKVLIRELIDTEDLTSPLTDAELVQGLERRGVRVSRRTVAKYRNAMGVENYRMRRCKETTS